MGFSGKQVIVLFDGTSATLGTGTNIERIKVLVEARGNAHLIYRRGINTITDIPLIQTLSPTEIKRDVITVYDEIIGLGLSSNDDIHIFGYSRGAISARMLSQYLVNPETTIQNNLKGSGSYSQRLSSLKVRTLGVFDPVYGRFNFLSRIPKYELEASVSEKVENYFEIIALDEHRFIFTLRSSITQFQKYIKSLREPSKLINNDKLGYFKQRFELSAGFNGSFISELIDSRRFIFMGGGHSDVGNQNGSASIGLQSFLIMLATCFERTPHLRDCFCDDEIISMMNDLRSKNKPSPNSENSKIFRFLRVVFNVGFEYRKRKKLSDQNFAYTHDIYQDWSSVELTHLLKPRL